jgi:hypothetical protein
MVDPMMIEIRGEAFNYPADITVDRDGEQLRRAGQVVRNLSQTQFELLMGSEEDWPKPGPEINADVRERFGQQQ